MGDKFKLLFLTLGLLAFRTYLPLREPAKFTQCVFFLKKILTCTQIELISQKITIYEICTVTIFFEPTFFTYYLQDLYAFFGTNFIAIHIKIKDSNFITRFGNFFRILFFSFLFFYCYNRNHNSYYLYVL